MIYGSQEEAAYEHSEEFYLEEYKVWEKSRCDGLIFDTDRLLESPMMSTDEVNFAGKAVLFVLAE